MSEIAYVEHPLSKGHKQELVAAGYQIVDARFAPKGSEIVSFTDAASPKPISREDVDAMEKDDVVELLELHGAKFDGRSGVETLREQLTSLLFVEL